jgi:hypothetical protein
MDIAHRFSSGYSRALTLQLIDPHTPAELPAVFSYDTRDPYAVRITFRDTGGEEQAIEWLVSRDLLRAGLDRATGDGDVRVGPTAARPATLFLHLRAPSGEALLELSRVALAAFVKGTETLVPFGAEVVTADLDLELAVLLTDGDGDPSIS